MGLRDIGASLPPGFRFYPSDEELVCHYLYKKITNEQVLKGTLVEIDLHICEPWQLPEVAKLNATEWYFFSFRDRKYATGFRANRATASGYWKATGKDRTVLDPVTQEVVGMRKTLVFYRNRAPNGIKTGWIMHEFRLETPHMPPKEEWVLCRVFHKSKEEDNNNNNSAKVMMYDHEATIPNSLTNQSIIMPPSGGGGGGYNRSLTSSFSMHMDMDATTTHHHHHDLNPINQNGYAMNLLHLSSRETNNNNNSIVTTQISPKGDHGYGTFLWDDHTADHGVEGMRFEVDNNNNNMVLL